MQALPAPECRLRGRRSDASEYVGDVAVPSRLVAVNPAGGGPSTWIPPDGLRPEAAHGAGADAGPFTSDETGASGFRRNFAVLRSGDSGQTFPGVAEPSARPDAFGPADGDSD